MSKIAGGIGGGIASGVRGDDQPTHNGGYHRGASQVPSPDYSVQYELDLGGDWYDADACSAIDVSMPTDKLIDACNRLFDACWNGDPRVLILREFFGTLDGRNVTGWDRAAGGYTSSDDSHLWHLHSSIHRGFALNAELLDAYADVVIGVDNHQQSGLGGGLQPAPPLIIPEDEVILAPSIIMNPDGSWGPPRVDGLDRASLPVLPGEAFLYVSVDCQDKPQHPSETPGWALLRAFGLGTNGDDRWLELAQPTLGGGVMPLPYLYLARYNVAGMRQITLRNLSSAPFGVRIGKE
jgi:hypothetical protein